MCNADAVKSEHADGLNGLAGRLFKMITGIPGNTVISPSCLFQTLSLAAAVTGGDTRAQIVDALGGDKQMRSEAASISEIERPKYGCKNFQYSTGASIWLDKDVRTNDPELARKGFPIACAIERVAMGGEDAKARMGEWLSSNTGGLYSEAPDMSPDTLAALIGAMHLRDSWSDGFEEDAPRVFQLDGGNAVRADFMLGWDHYDVLDTEGSTTLSKDLTSGCRMYASLPPAGCSLKDYVSTGAAWKNISSNIAGKSTESYRECKVYMPRFELVSDGVDLKRFLMEAGLTRLFEPGADFGPLSPDDLMVDDVIQSTRLKIDEEGLEGASYALMCVCAGALPEDKPEPREIVFDRPFAVAVTAPDGHPLFVGTVERPSAEHRPSKSLRGVVYGAAIGDALGVPYEFMARDSFECDGMVGGGAHGMPAGTFSDDTSLLLATCDSIRERGGFDIEDMRERFQAWLFEGAYTADGSAFDVGNATAAALRQGFGCDGERSNGNGSLMRIAPLALTDATDDEIRAVSAITHAHPVSMEACVFFVHVLRDLLAGEWIEDAIGRNIPDDERFAFLKGVQNASRDGIRSTGYVLDTLGAALWCACNTDSYEECVLEAVNLGDDSDTTACVAGALAGSMYGPDDIPWMWMEQLRGKEIIDSCLF
ncbi:ADP-ribosylglycohydrolase family protein [Adlercreutzia sp. R7]|uniref:ADP-ribosylglycohydrolase family protein n=1 Tax=Adlercreutzia wanghongyangiae TaxID=3111451 RepID=A0ABU6IKV4_9ACTN|nr:ADP-ribosylglycohydrolase family protein [Adlercreutzia sp. R7]